MSARVVTLRDLLTRAREFGYDAGTIDGMDGAVTFYAAWPYTGGDSIFAPYAYLTYGPKGEATTLKLNGVRQTGLTRAGRVLLLWQWLEDNAPERRAALRE